MALMPELTPQVQATMTHTAYAHAQGLQTSDDDALHRYAITLHAKVDHLIDSDDLTQDDQRAGAREIGFQLIGWDAAAARITAADPTRDPQPSAAYLAGTRLARALYHAPEDLAYHPQPTRTRRP
ncbi:hypothetical protein ACFQX6_67020 [Streptosporangium lutulentum]